MLHLEAVERLGEVATLSVADLVEQQGVHPIDDAGELAGPRIDDFDEFVDAIRSLRQA